MRAPGSTVVKVKRRTSIDNCQYRDHMAPLAFFRHCFSMTAILQWENESPRFQEARLIFSQRAVSVDVEIEGCVHVEEGAAGSCAVGWQLLHLNLPPPVHLPPLLLLVVNIGKSFNKRGSYSPQ